MHARQQREASHGLVAQCEGFIEAVHGHELALHSHPGVPQVGARRQRFPQDGEQLLRLVGAARHLLEGVHAIAARDLVLELPVDERELLAPLVQRGAAVEQTLQGIVVVHRDRQGGAACRSDCGPISAQQRDEGRGGVEGRRIGRQHPRLLQRLLRFVEAALLREHAGELALGPGRIRPDGEQVPNGLLLLRERFLREPFHQ